MSRKVSGSCVKRVGDPVVSFRASPTLAPVSHLPALVALASALTVLAQACADAPQPAGAPNARIAELAAAGWQSRDTAISLDPRTGEETVRAYVSDLSPDTLADGRVIYQVATYMPVLESCVGNDDPVFCTQETLTEFTRAALRYPPAARARGLGGSGVATFVISATGRVTDTGIERSLGDVLDQEILRVVGTLPPWRPGFHDGHPVAVRYRLPVSFAAPVDER